MQDYYNSRTILYSAVNTMEERFFHFLNQIGKMNASAVNWNMTERNIHIADSPRDEERIRILFELMPYVLENAVTAYVPKSLVRGDYILMNQEAAKEKMKRQLEEFASEESASEVTDSTSEEMASEVTDSTSEEMATEVAETPSEKTVLEVAEAPSEETVLEVAEASSEETVPEVAEISSEETVLEVAETPSEETVPEVAEISSEETVSETTETPSEETVPEITELPSDESVSEVTETPSEETVTEMVEPSSETSVAEVIETPSEEVTSKEEELPVEVPSPEAIIEEAQKELTEAQKVLRAPERVNALREYFMNRFQLDDELSDKEYTLQMRTRCNELGLKSRVLCSCLIFAAVENNENEVYEATSKALEINLALVKMDARKSYVKWVKTCMPEFYKEYPETTITDFLNVFREGKKQF